MEKMPHNINFASEVLNRVKGRIMHEWESNVRRDVHLASNQTGPALRAQLPEILENLASNLSTGANASTLDAAGEIGRAHGEQRAGLSEYTHAQVLAEYRILRKVIFNVLADEHFPVSEKRDTILNVLDEGLEKALEQFVLMRSENLQRSNRDLEHFAAIAAHDLKSPLATISGFAEILEDRLAGKLELEDRQCIQAIRRSSARMTQLIDRLLEYATVGREVKPFEIVRMNELVKDVLESMNTTITKKKAKIQTTELPDVFGDASLLNQLFQNIISNALKYSNPTKTPQIQISCDSEDQYWIFSVQDNGVGFDPKEKDNIFSLYKRLDSTKDQTGLGIGLATCRKVVELHGGSLWAESKLGEGSTFFFSLPKLM